MVEDKHAQTAVEKGSGHKEGSRNPAAGPHAKEHLTDHDKTPGTGSLPSKNSRDVDAGPE